MNGVQLPGHVSREQRYSNVGIKGERTTRFTRLNRPPVTTNGNFMPFPRSTHGEESGRAVQMEKLRERLILKLQLSILNQTLSQMLVESLNSFM